MVRKHHPTMRTDPGQGSNCCDRPGAAFGQSREEGNGFVQVAGASRGWARRGQGSCQEGRLGVGVCARGPASRPAGLGVPLLLSLPGLSRLPQRARQVRSTSLCPIPSPPSSEHSRGPPSGKGPPLRAALGPHQYHPGHRPPSPAP